MTEKQVIDLLGAEARTFIKENPSRFLSLASVKAWEFWKPWSPRVDLWKNLLYSLFFVPLATLAIVWLFRWNHSSFERMLLLWYLVLSTAAHMVFIAIIRYRVPLDTVLILFAGIFAAEALRRWGKSSDRAGNGSEDSHGLFGPSPAPNSSLT